jgi:hypothetical protein
MLRVQDQADIENARFLIGGHLAGQHVEEVGGVGQILTGFEGLLAIANARVSRDHGRQLGLDANTPVQVGRPIVSGIRTVVVAEGGDHGPHTVHGAQGRSQLSDEGEDLLGQAALLSHGRTEAVQVRLAGKFPVPEQPGGLHEVRVVRQILEEVAAVAKLADFSIDLADRRIRGIDALESSSWCCLALGHRCLPKSFNGECTCQYVFRRSALDFLCTEVEASGEILKSG